MKTAYVQSAVIESKDNQISAKVSGRVMPFRKLFFVVIVIIFPILVFILNYFC